MWGGTPWSAADALVGLLGFWRDFDSIGDSGSGGTRADQGSAPHSTHIQRLAVSRSIVINAKVPGNTVPLRPPAGTGPNFAETMNTR